MHLPLPSDPP